MNQMYPQEDTQETLEGNAAHWVLTEKIANHDIKINDQTPQGVMVTQEMLEGADLFVDHLRQRNVNFKHLYVEQRVEISTINEHCFGTPDVFYFDVSTNTIDVFDYKFGHKFVDEFKNYQCVLYAEGVLNKLAKTFGEAPGVFDQLCKVNITIIQPRCFYKGSPIRTWSFPAIDLRPLVNIIRSAASEALSNPKAKPGEQCEDCPGRHSCAALQQDAYRSSRVARASLPLELPLNAASLELKMLKESLLLLQARVDGLSEFVTSKLRQGERAPFHSLGTTRSKRVWNRPIDEIIALGRMFDVDLSKQNVVTPTQAIKLKVDEAVINCYSEYENGSIKLEDHNPNDVSKIFGV
jgi:hypothetical protein